MSAPISPDRTIHWVNHNYTPNLPRKESHYTEIKRKIIFILNPAGSRQKIQITQEFFDNEHVPEKDTIEIYKNESFQPHYRGKTEYGYPHGEGKLNDGFIEYQGHFKNGKFDGKGSLTSLKHKTTLSGEWFNGKLNGFGTLTSETMVFHGNFQNSKRNGAGKELINKQILYEGSWVQNKLEGPGKISEFCNPVKIVLDNTNTNSKIQALTGDQKILKVFTGIFKNNLPHDVWMLTYPSESEKNIYHLLYDQGIRKLFAKIFYPDGRIYCGLINGEIPPKPNGEGTMRFSNGVSVPGYFKENQKTFKGTILLDLGEIFTGSIDIVSCQPKGLGTITDAKDQTFKVAYVKGKPFYLSQSRP